jgi:hypothetical protein
VAARGAQTESLHCRLARCTAWVQLSPAARLSTQVPLVSQTAPAAHCLSAQGAPAAGKASHLPW